MRKIFIYKLLSFLVITLSSFQISQQIDKIEIETNDGNIFVGTIIKETDISYTLETANGNKIEISKNSVTSLKKLDAIYIDGKIRRADKNNSLYIFTPSAFPIEHNKSYCRNWCIFFPSYNRGFTNNFSFQIGGLIFPGMAFQDMPYVISGKFSLPNLGPAQLTTGMMYVSIPSTNFGTGFLFGGGTIGNKFTHASLIYGFGYFRYESDWEFSEQPIMVFASNIRLSNRFALVSEFWLPPEIEDFSVIPFMSSLRFIGRDFSVDFGGFFEIGSVGESVPLPLLNLTYHFD